METDDQRLMAEYGITAENRVLYHFDGYRYDRLADALNYAKIRRKATEESLPRKRDSDKSD